MPTAKLSTGEIHYDVYGEGPPLLMVAGLGGLGAYWQPQIRQFSKDFRVIVHDHRGTGRSSRSEIDYSVGQMADDLLGLMDHLKLDKAHFVGHSTGGAIGQVLAIDHPERIDRLVLYATWTKCDTFMRRVFECRKALLKSPTAAEYISATAFFLFPDWWINQNAALLDAADAASLPSFPSATIAASRCDAVMNFDREQDLGRISAPTLVLCAQDDFLTPAYFSRQLAQLIPGARLQIMPRGGHACSQVLPEEFIAAVLPFLHEDRPRPFGSVSHLYEGTS